MEPKEKYLESNYSCTKVFKAIYSCLKAIMFEFSYCLNSVLIDTAIMKYLLCSVTYYGIKKDFLYLISLLFKIHDYRRKRINQDPSSLNSLCRKFLYILPVQKSISLSVLHDSLLVRTFLYVIHCLQGTFILIKFVNFLLELVLKL